MKLLIKLKNDRIDVSNWSEPTGTPCMCNTRYDSNVMKQRQMGTQINKYIILPAVPNNTECDDPLCRNREA